jgi:phenylacetate-CoA ligase
VISKFSSKLNLTPPHLQAFMQFAARHSPYYREFDWAQNLLIGLPVRLQDVPITKKSTVQKSPMMFRSDFDPPQAGRVVEKHTSGSTGEPMPIFKSESHFAINAAENERLFKDWKTDDHKVSVVYLMPEDEKPLGTIELQTAPNGNVFHFIYTRSVDQIAALIEKTRPSFASARPSQFLSMLEGGADFSFLKVLQTNTEAVPEELRRLVAALPQCRIDDSYGAVETGMIAASCQKCGLYHLAERNVHIEVLRDDDEPASEGELGRVVATVFNNPSMPLLRYDIGDMVKFTTSSPCQPGRMSFTRIYGRERMMFKLPSGERIMPELDSETLLALGVKRFKLVQTTADEIEFRYIGKAVDLAVIQDMINREISSLFKVRLVAVTELPNAPSGKYLWHERLVE